MKKISLKIAVLALFAICMTFTLGAQDVIRTAEVEKKEAKKQEHRMKRLEKMADKLEMSVSQRDQFMIAQAEFNTAAKAIKDSEVEKKEKKAQLKALATEHKTRLSTFLSEEQVTKIEKRLMKKKGKHKTKKGKRVKQPQPE